MLVMVSADWHIGVLQYGVIDKDGKNSRLLDVEKTIHETIDYALEHDIKLYIQAGDVFHTNKPTPEEQLVFLKVLKRLESVPFKSRFIIGNHDYNGKFGSCHALRIFQEILGEQDKIKIYDQTTWERLPGVYGGKDLLVIFYPFGGNDIDWNNMSSFDNIDYTAVVCHSHLEGAVVGAEPFEIKTDQVTRFSQLPVDHVWAGHFHKPQRLSDKPLAFYPGSIQPVDFNERMDLKGVVIVDLLKKSMMPVKFKTRDLYQIELADTFTIGDEHRAKCKDAIVKVIFTVNQDYVKEFDEMELKQQLLDWGVHSIASISLDIRKVEVRRNAEINLDKSVKDNFLTFMHDRNTELKDKVIQTGLEVIEKCQQK